MALKSVIVVRNKGQKVTDDYFKKALKDYTSLFSLTTIADGEISATCVTTGEKNAVSFEGDGGIKEISEAFEDHNLVMWLGQCDYEIGEGDRPPYTIVDKDGKSQIVAYLEGEFPGFVHPESSHPTETYVVAEYLAEKCQEVFDQQSEDIEKTLKVFDTPVFRKEIRNILLPRGNIVMFAANGEVMRFSVSEKTADLPWGWVSDHLGGTTVEKKEEKKLSPMEILKLKKSQKTEAKPPVEEPKTDTKVPPDAGKEQKPEEFAPPSDYFGNRLKKWYNRNREGGWKGTQGNGGHIPAIDWTKRPSIPAEHLKKSSALRAHKEFSGIGPENKGVITEVPSVISPSKISDLSTWLKSIELISPEKIQEVEDTYPTFTDQVPEELQYTLEKVCQWPSKKIREFIKGAAHEQALYSLLIEFMQEYREYMDMKEFVKWKGQQKEEKKDEPPAADMSKLSPMERLKLKKQQEAAQRKAM